jgi:hypothetical protein
MVAARIPASACGACRFLQSRTVQDAICVLLMVETTLKTPNQNERAFRQLRRGCFPYKSRILAFARRKLKNLYGTGRVRKNVLPVPG